VGECVIFNLLAILTACCCLLLCVFCPPASACPVTEETREVRGGSLSGLLDAGTEITVINGFYDCHEVLRGDIVAFHLSGHDSPLSKIARGLPGDNFAVEGDQLFINHRLAVTTDGTPYRLDVKAAQMISLYVKSYHGVIPPDTYLLLGNVATGSLDSTRFGLIDREGIVGKIVARKKKQ